MDEITLTLNNPLTEEEWDLIEDVDFDKTNSIEFHTKHGKTVKFVKCTDERTEDMISRQAAIDRFVKLGDYYNGRDEVKRGIHQCIAVAYDLPSAQPKEVIPHRNYKYLSDYWCACGWHLGKKGDVKYCAVCGRKVNWDD